MITLYNPANPAVPLKTSGREQDGVSPQLVALNILIELRVLSQLMWDQQYQGKVTQTLEQYRSDAVNDTVNPSI